MTTTDLTGLLGALVAIDSRNPALVPGAPGEGAIADYTAGFLLSSGFEVALTEPQPGRPSVIARLAGSGDGRSLLLNGHYDTVAFGAMPRPLEPRVEGGRMYGRGSYDMKGGLAAVLAAAARLAAGPQLRGDIIVAAVADEEHASIGTESALAHMRAAGWHADAGIVAEPTELQLCVAHKGFVWASIVTQGHAAHGSAWQDGVDAIAHMGRVLAALEQYGLALRSRPRHPLLDVPSLHASLIRGGDGLSTYPARCELDLERRTLPGESAAQVADQLRAMLASLSEQDAQFHAQLELGLAREPMQAALDTPLVVELQRTVERRLGAPPALFGMGGWTDAALQAAAGIPSVLFGPSGAGAHADEEWVDLASVELCAAVYADTARALCG
jgi:acetylornithine deacetylase